MKIKRLDKKLKKKRLSWSHEIIHLKKARWGFKKEENNKQNVEAGNKQQEKQEPQKTEKEKLRENYRH